MKKIALFIVGLIAFASANAQVKKVLFLGNSYTYVNDLPQLLEDLALSKGDTIYTDENTPGGYQLIQHATNSATLSKIKANDWDFVVLQEQSQKPSFSPAQVQSDVYPYAKQLNDSIKSNYSCTETVFFMTWGRENGDASNCASYPPVCTYTGMQQRLRESYLEMGDSNLATVSPVGVAWKNMRDSFPSVNLYAGDGSHPSLHGSYLAACVFYCTLYQKSTIGASFVPAGITTIDAFNIQTIATNTVLDSLSLWRVNANHPTANFNYSGGGTINFTNTSTNGQTYFWDFGDGNTSTQMSPNNSYAANNSYQVQLIVYSNDSCFTDTITQIVTVTASGINEIDNNNETNIYPNPTDNSFSINSKRDFTSGTIIDLNGKVILMFNPSNKIDISSFKKGVYFIKLYDQKRVEIIRKLIKN